MNNGQWTIKECAVRTDFNYFPKEKTIIVNCQLSIVNSVHFPEDNFDKDY